MTRLRLYFLFGITSTLVLSGIAASSTLVQTQLADVKNVSTSVFVSQYLPENLKNLEVSLKQEIDANLQKAGLIASGSSLGHLSADISGWKVDDKRCGDLFLVQIKVQFSEDIILKRAPEMKLPNQSFYTWEDEWVNTLEPDEMMSVIKSRVNDSVELFIEKVQFATSLKKEERKKQN